MLSVVPTCYGIHAPTSAPRMETFTYHHHGFPNRTGTPGLKFLSLLDMTIVVTIGTFLDTGDKTARPVPTQAVNLVAVVLRRGATSVC
jgi:hypothetical protein